MVRLLIAILGRCGCRLKKQQVLTLYPVPSGIALRACETDQSFEAMIGLAAVVINSR